MSFIGPSVKFTNRRVKLVLVSPEMILRELQQPQVQAIQRDPAGGVVSFGARVTRFSGLPDGIEFVSCQFDTLRNCFALLVSHPDFAEVPEGSLIPFNDGLTLLAWIEGHFVAASVPCRAPEQETTEARVIRGLEPVAKVVDDLRGELASVQRGLRDAYQAWGNREPAEAKPLLDEQYRAKLKERFPAGLFQNGPWYQDPSEKMRQYKVPNRVDVPTETAKFDEPVPVKSMGPMRFVSYNSKTDTTVLGFTENGAFRDAPETAAVNKAAGDYFDSMLTRFAETPLGSQKCEASPAPAVEPEPTPPKEPEPTGSSWRDRPPLL